MLNVISAFQFSSIRSPSYATCENFRRHQKIDGAIPIGSSQINVPHNLMRTIMIEKVNSMLLQFAERTAFLSSGFFHAFPVVEAKCRQKQIASIWLAI